MPLKLNPELTPTAHMRGYIYGPTEAVLADQTTFYLNTKRAAVGRFGKRSFDQKAQNP